jgi:signal transduction histidine kinase
METLLDDLLAYSRAGRQRHPVERVDTAALIHNVTDMLAPPPHFTVKVLQPMPVMRVERIPLETVFRNLIGNAIKHHHHPAEGVVEISAQEQENFVEFAVTDNGPGIDPAYHQRIFEMFQTLQPRDQVEGSGVGLAVVKKFVESRGGTIQIESSLGSGATFRFTWPKSVTSTL